MASRTSSSSKWRERAVAAEAERDEWAQKYNTLLDRLMGGLAGALVDGGYLPQEQERRAAHDREQTALGGTNTNDGNA